MTVLQILKGLIGKEDVNWGNSSTTFNRETHAGTTTPMSYVDAECIPSTGLGNYVGTHLHKQHTDTGTNATTFYVGLHGNAVGLQSAGQGTTRTFTFPEANQQLAGGSELATTNDATKGAGLVGVTDAGAYYSSTTVEAALQEIGSDVTTLQAQVHDRGYLKGLRLSYSSTTDIAIGGGTVSIRDGTNNVMSTLASQITQKFSGGGGNQNGNCVAFGASTLYYIYIDSATVDGSTSLEAGDFYNSDSAPTWDHIDIGWYLTNGAYEDRCVGSFRTNASSEIVRFSHISDNYYKYQTHIATSQTVAGASSCPESWSSATEDVSNMVPKFARRANFTVAEGDAGAVYVYFAGDTNNAILSYANEFVYLTQATSGTLDVSLTDTQTFYWAGSGGRLIGIHVNGYYIDEL